LPLRREAFYSEGLLSPAAYSFSVYDYDSAYAAAIAFSLRHAEGAAFSRLPPAFRHAAPLSSANIFDFCGLSRRRRDAPRFRFLSARALVATMLAVPLPIACFSCLSYELSFRQMDFRRHFTRDDAG